MILIGGDEYGKTQCYQIDSTNHIIDGIQYSEEEFNRILRKIEE